MDFLSSSNSYKANAASFVPPVPANLASYFLFDGANVAEKTRNWAPDGSVHKLVGDPAFNAYSMVGVPEASYLDSGVIDSADLSAIIIAKVSATAAVYTAFFGTYGAAQAGGAPGNTTYGISLQQNSNGLQVFAGEQTAPGGGDTPYAASILGVPPAAVFVPFLIRTKASDSSLQITNLTTGVTNTQAVTAGNTRDLSSQSLLIGSCYISTNIGFGALTADAEIAGGCIWTAVVSDDDVATQYAWFQSYYLKRFGLTL